MKKQFDIDKWAPHEVVPTTLAIKREIPAELSADSDIEIVTQRIESARVDITSNYEDWLNLAFALANELGESGRSYFHRISRFYSGYDEVEADRKYTSCLASGKGSVNISTFFHLALQAGVSVSIRRQSTPITPKTPMAEVAEQTGEVPVQSEPAPTFSDMVKDDLPDFLKRVIADSHSNEDADILILGTLTTISPCLPHISGVYDRRKVFPNLFLFVTAQASAGKGRLALCKNLVAPIHEKLREEYNKAKSIYEEEMTAFLKSSKKDGLSRPKEPRMSTLIIPANSSATAMCQTLYDNEGVGLMFETEGDTLAQTFKSEHGNYSDALRKAFHHESISYNRRKDREFVELKYPKLSAVLSGTPRQVLSLIPDAENGLFSRFIFYSLDVNLVWNNVFAVNDNGSTVDEQFEALGKRFEQLHNELAAASPMLFRLSTPQELEFNQFFESVQKEYATLYGLDIIGSIRRLGLITYRIAMILTTLRFMEGLDMKERIFCSDTDFQTALTMVQVLLRHTAKVFETLPSATAINLPTEKTEVKQKFLDALPSDFGRDTMLSVAKSLNLPQRSAERYVQSFCKDGKLVRASHGSYRKP